jgi:hypothetical protein
MTAAVVRRRDLFSVLLLCWLLCATRSVFQFCGTFWLVDSCDWIDWAKRKPKADNIMKKGTIA